ncbi:MULTISPECIES: SpoIIE family protein phosphatase [Streptomyces]|uniref:SpoIIE family protein phosphatase n=1 Tax=Streptomyces koelreuteriae TaxID=2838015 RepID=A0ABX8G3U6_9ACTN|nr:MULTISPECIES: SpoIIE family protein phosphatase [Streptomyces]QWB28034.1 SpoIIE family protein phosphatase [Streptomyces koelreuteriae]UUA11147.1 SpoIIE family protein phosphatase [Streptomyces koelreuteriae]UUA18753.1 SpoIIE family protein phosphatase [Streptomyces sp. CRCS-T-1]
MRTRPGGGSGRLGLTSTSVLASGFLAVLIGVAFAVLLQVIGDARGFTADARASREAITDASVLEQHLIDLETGQRGFVITRDEAFLQPWQAARESYPAEARRFLASATSPEQRRLAGQINRDIGSFITDYSVPLVEAVRRDDPSASSPAETAEGKRRVDALRASFTTYITDERAKLQDRQDATDSSAQRAVVVACAGLAGLTGLIVTLTVFQHRAIVRPLRRAAAAAGRLAKGDLEVRVPSSRVEEVAALAASFNTMAESLQDSRARTEEARERLEFLYKRLELLYGASVSVGTGLDVEQTARELARVAVPGFADFTTVDLLEPVLRGDEPAAGAGARLRRVAADGIRDDAPLAGPADLPDLSSPPPAARAPLSGQARLDADLRHSTEWAAEQPEAAARVLAYGIHSRIRTPLQARGVTLGTVDFWRQRPDPFGPDDVAFAEELAAKAAVAVDNARRFTRERSTALALQRHLLPQRLPYQTAVEVASRYLPAWTRTGVGGDWYDVIPLSGSRVALVVGDVVGHGLQASAAMGRLRTAVRTLADVDLPPDELLTHLDDLILHLCEGEPVSGGPGDDEGADGWFSSADLGATCLYAVYDPVSRRCTLATAGHPMPAVLGPDGTAHIVSGHVGPPLGVGGLPFEATDLDLDAGSVLALYTDGLVEARHRDIDVGLAELCLALARPADSLEEACDTVIGSLLTDRAADDVALLLARTRALPAGHVATWQIPAETVQVERARKLVVEQLDAWGLTEATFVIELVVSELVTNAIRYGQPPIQLRLIRDHTLICEVSDTSSTAPHLRRARAFDEGGRGLLLVAQLTQGWGTRQTTTGKTIWCEQALPAS